MEQDTASALVVYVWHPVAPRHFKPNPLNPASVSSRVLLVIVRRMKRPAVKRYGNLAPLFAGHADTAAETASTISTKPNASTMSTRGSMLLTSCLRTSSGTGRWPDRYE